MSEKIKLVAFSLEAPARLLTNYLLAQNIDVEYQYLANAEHGHAVVLVTLAHENKAKNITEEFLLNPHDEKYQQLAWQTGEFTNLSDSGVFSIKKVYGDLKGAPFTATILLLCGITYLLASIGFSVPYHWLQIQPFHVLQESQQWWRIWGPALIHFSLLHIAFNLLWWWSLGKKIEKTFGFSSLLLLFVFSAAISNLAQLLVSGPYFGGLSGVVYALVGCVWWLGWLKPSWGISLPKPIIGFLLIWLVVGYLDVLPIHMANTAHLAGLISGCLFAYFLSKKTI